MTIKETLQEEGFQVPDLTFLPFEILANYSQWAEDFEFENKEPFVESLRNSINNLKEETKESEEALDAFGSITTSEEFRARVDKVNTLIDGFADTMFVAFNGMYKCYRILGSSPIQALAGTIATMMELAIANNSKRFPDGTVKKNSIGKVLKPAEFTPPSYLPIINSIIEKNNGNLPTEDRELSNGSI